MSGPPHVWTLALEMSNPTSALPGAAGDASSVAIGRAGARGMETVGSEHIVPAAARSSDDDLFPAIERLLARTGVPVRDLRGGRIAVSVGPGGYTGLRVACAAAKSLAEAVGASCVSVPTALVALHAHGRALDGGRKRAVALASKAESAWVHIEGRGEGHAGRIIGAGDIATMAGKDRVAVLIADSHLPAAVREECRVHGIDVVVPALSAAACLGASLGREPVDPAELNPMYAREPDAVTMWRQRGR